MILQNETEEEEKEEEVTPRGETELARLFENINNKLFANRPLAMTLFVSLPLLSTPPAPELALCGMSLSSALRCSEVKNVRGR